ILKRANAHKNAVQLGRKSRLSIASAHHRAWHYGKCRDANLNRRPMEFPAPAEYILGGYGYVLNAAAIRHLLWASIFLRGWLSHVMYEDMAIGEVAPKTGIALLNVDMGPAIHAVEAY
ncbi:MAG: hypothetical protein ACR2I8_11745, partial [Steroidobacteraceae bacterium]